MKIAIISYSLTGNNDALASSVAQELGAEHIKVTEPKSRKMGSIIMDLIFNKTPKIKPQPAGLESFDWILFFGPVWIGQAATPLRVYFKHLKKNPRKYGFISISGGADGPNPKLAGDLKKRMGVEPSVLIDLHIADLLPPEPKPTRAITSVYRINKDDIKKLKETIVKFLRETI